jgi:hypothetical protein
MVRHDEVLLLLLPVDGALTRAVAPVVCCGFFV